MRREGEFEYLPAEHLLQRSVNQDCGLVTFANNASAQVAEATLTQYRPVLEGQ